MTFITINFISNKYTVHMERNQWYMTPLQFSQFSYWKVFNVPKVCEWNFKQILYCVSSVSKKNVHCFCSSHKIRLSVNISTLFELGSSFSVVHLMSLKLVYPKTGLLSIHSPSYLIVIHTSDWVTCIRFINESSDIIKVETGFPSYCCTIHTILKMGSVFAHHSYNSNTIFLYPMSKRDAITTALMTQTLF